jgi:hypothetical protein
LDEWDLANFVLGHIKASVLNSQQYSQRLHVDSAGVN